MLTIADIIHKELDDFIYRVKINMYEQDRIATRKTFDSLKKENVSNDGGQVWGASWFERIETGTPKGERPNDAKMLMWVKARHLESLWGKPAHTISFIISNAIQANGSLLWQQYRGRKSGLIYSKEIDVTKKNITKDVAKFYAVEIKTTIDNLTK